MLLPWKPFPKKENEIRKRFMSQLLQGVKAVASLLPSTTKPDWLNPSNTVHAVLCYINKGNQYLLLLKSKGKFGEGFWNAPGGKIEPNESPEAAAKREVLEETGLKVLELTKAGSLKFFFGKAKQKPDWFVEVFVCSKFEGEPKESKEGRLGWFRKNALPYDEMWADDRHWLPLLTQGKRFEGTFIFSEDSKELLGSSITLR
jgi:8-oxo-dGTP pyrophosphatase MutT (NUDIX family)